MAFLDGFLSKLKLNDDFDDYDDDDFFDENEDRPASRRFSRHDDDLDDLDDIPVKKKETRKAKPASSAKTEKTSEKKTRASYKEEPKKTSKRFHYDDEYDDFDALEDEPAKPVFGRKNKSSKVTPITRSSYGSGMEVMVIRPESMEDTKEIADYLLARRTVVLNLEGQDVDLAQRIIDFTCGACYSVSGGLKKISSYIFILTPADVEISGDIESILGEDFNTIPSMRSQY